MFRQPSTDVACLRLGEFAEELLCKGHPIVPSLTNFNLSIDAEKKLWMLKKSCRKSQRNIFS